MGLICENVKDMSKINKEASRMVLSPSMKLADLIELNYSLLIVLSRLGIGLGFGEDTVEEVCRNHGIDLNSFLLICGIYTYDDYIAPDGLLKTGNPADVVRYLHSSHSFYLEDELRKLEDSLEELVAPCDSTQKKVIYRFFSEYRKEVENHFAYEENTVFPYVDALLHGNSRGGYSIEQFEENHSNIDEKLNDLKNIVMKYLPPVCDTVLRTSVLYHIFFLEDDLDRHTLIENNVLVPMVNRLEENEKRK